MPGNTPALRLAASAATISPLNTQAQHTFNAAVKSIQAGLNPSLPGPTSATARDLTSLLRSKDVRDVDLSNMPYGFFATEHGQKVIPMVVSHPRDEINLNGNNRNSIDDNIKSFSHLRNANTKTLSLWLNGINTKNGVMQLRQIAKNPNIEILDIEHNGLGRRFDAVFSGGDIVKDAKVKKLIIGYNDIGSPLSEATNSRGFGDIAVKHLAEGIETTALDLLDASGNKLGLATESSTLIPRAVVKTSLKTLNLSNNSLEGEEIAKNLGQALAHNNLLKKVDLSDNSEFLPNEALHPQDLPAMRALEEKELASRPQTKAFFDAFWEEFEKRERARAQDAVPPAAATPSPTLLPPSPSSPERVQPGRAAAPVQDMGVPIIEEQRPPQPARNITPPQTPARPRAEAGKMSPMKAWDNLTPYQKMRIEMLTGLAALGITVGVTTWLFERGGKKEQPPADDYWPDNQVPASTQKYWDPDPRQTSQQIWKDFTDGQSPPSISLS